MMNGRARGIPAFGYIDRRCRRNLRTAQAVHAQRRDQMRPIPYFRVSLLGCSPMSIPSEQGIYQGISRNLARFRPLWAVLGASRQADAATCSRFPVRFKRRNSFRPNRESFSKKRIARLGSVVPRRELRTRPPTVFKFNRLVRNGVREVQSYRYSRTSGRGRAPRPEPYCNPRSTKRPLDTITATAPRL